LSIKYLKHNKIDFKKWDWCISRSFNGIAYAYSWYLDIVSENWDALILGDYETVMPLTHSKKMGINYVFQPLYTQQLGVFSITQLTPKIVSKFIDAIPKEFKLLNINLNKFNKVENKKYKTVINKTYELDLIEPYDKIYKNFSTNTKRNIKKAKSNNINIIESVSANELIDLIKNNLGQKIKRLNEHHYNNIRKIIAFGIKHQIGNLIGAYTAQNTLCASAFFLTTNNKSIYLFAASNNEGIESRAMFLLIDYFIKQNSERNITLDFEGSNIESLARFYSGFNAKKCNYINVKVNKLPWILRLIKT